MGLLEKKCHVSRVSLHSENPVSLIVVFTDKKSSHQVFQICSGVISAKYNDITNEFIIDNPADLSFAVNEYNRMKSACVPDDFFNRLLSSDHLIETDRCYVGLIPILSCVTDNMVKYQAEVSYMINLKESISKSFLVTHRTMEMTRTINEFKASLENGESYNPSKDELTNLQKIEEVWNTSFIPTTHIQDVLGFVSFSEMINFFGTKTGTEKYTELMSIKTSLSLGEISLTPNYDKSQAAVGDLLNFHKMIVHSLESINEE